MGDLTGARWSDLCSPRSPLSFLLVSSLNHQSSVSFTVHCSLFGPILLLYFFTSGLATMLSSEMLRLNRQKVKVYFDDIKYFDVFKPCTSAEQKNEKQGEPHIVKVRPENGSRKKYFFSLSPFISFVRLITSTNLKLLHSSLQARCPISTFYIDFGWRMFHQTSSTAYSLVLNRMDQAGGQGHL